MKIVGAIVGSILGLVLASFLVGALLFYGWNYGAVPAFGGRVIDYWPTSVALALLFNAVTMTLRSIFRKK